MGFHLRKSARSIRFVYFTRQWPTRKEKACADVCPIGMVQSSTFIGQNDPSSATLKLLLSGLRKDFVRLNGGREWRNS